jgi:hypothetical protein
MKIFKLPIILLAIATASLNVSAQVRNYKFATTGTESQIIESHVDSTGNIYILGSFRNSFSFEDKTVTSPWDLIESPGEPFILKTNSVGKLVYLKALIGLDELFYSGSHKIDINEKGEIAAFFMVENQKGVKIGESEIKFDSANVKGLVIKISKQGYVMWARPYNAYGNKPVVFPKDLKIDEEGNVYISGYFRGELLELGNDKNIAGMGNENQMFLAKYSPTANTEWVYAATPEAGDSVGSIMANQIHLGKDDLIYLLGENNGNKRFIIGASILQNQGLSNAFVSCFDKLGNPLWATQCISDQYSKAEDISTNNLGEVVLSCYFNGNNYSIQDYSSSGQAGEYTGVAAKFENSGKLLDGIYIGNTLPYLSDYTKESVVSIDDSSNIFLITSMESGGTYSIGIVRFKNESDVPWTVLSNSTESVYLNGATTDNDNNIFFRGSTYNSADFNIGNTTVLHDAANAGNYSEFYGVIDRMGNVNYIYNKPNIGNSRVSFRDIVSDRFGGCYVIGDFYGVDAALDQYEFGKDQTEGLYVSRYSYTIEVNGIVQNMDGLPIPEGMVHLYGYTYRQRSPIADSVEINADGSYSFYDIPLGKYLLIASTQFNDGAEYLPSYYVSAGHWNEAEHLIVKEPFNQYDVNIIMTAKSTNSGEAELSGNVQEVEESDIFEADSQSTGNFKSTTQKPKKKGRAKLARDKLKSDWEIIAETETDEYGNFEFTNVPDGYYTVIIEIPGLPHEDYQEVEVTGGSSFINMNYLVGEEAISSVGTPQSTGISTYSETNVFELYPNPSNGTINIDIPENESVQQFYITNLQGKMINSSVSIHDNITISDLFPGVYFANITTNSHKETIKFVITK